MSRIAVLGAGSWGTALALSLARREDHRIALWAHTDAHAQALAAHRENRRYLPGIPLPAAIQLTGSLEAAAREADAILIVVPSQHVRLTVTALAAHLRPSTMLLSASKGIEDNTLLRMTEVIASALNTQADTRAADYPTGVLSGPSFAQEVAAGAPSAVTVAFADGEVAERAQAMLSTDSMRLYRNTDVPGVELGGALKNVIAIAAGVVTGLGLGYNAGAALITRGIAEMTRLALACGGRRETLAGLAGVGDLILTCTGTLSRNRFVGMELGRGRSLPEIVERLEGKVAEGVRTTGAALGLAARHSVSMPIAEEVYAVLHGTRSAQEAVRALMARPGKDE